jgi:hypothetical protein
LSWRELSDGPVPSESRGVDPKTYHSLFTSTAGQEVLAELEALAMWQRTVPPSESADVLRHVEGARATVAHIHGKLRKAERGE